MDIFLYCTPKAPSQLQCTAIISWRDLNSAGRTQQMRQEWNLTADHLVGLLYLQARSEELTSAVQLSHANSISLYTASFFCKMSTLILLVWNIRPAHTHTRDKNINTHMNRPVDYLLCSRAIVQRAGMHALHSYTKSQKSTRANTTTQQSQQTASLCFSATLGRVWIHVLFKCVCLKVWMLLHSSPSF